MVAKQPGNRSRKILYYADIHGPEVVKARSIKRNVSVAGTTKVIAICQSLRLAKHDVIVYSPGSPAERSGKCYRGMTEYIHCPDRERIEIIYGATVDNRLLRRLIAAVHVVCSLPRVMKKHSVDTVIIYNLTLTSVVLSLLSCFAGYEVYLDYEDSARANRYRRSRMLRQMSIVYEIILRHIAAGVIGASNELLSSIGIEYSLWLPGILSHDLVIASKNCKKQPWQAGRPIRMIYAGGLDPSKGIDRFVQAIDTVDASIDMVVCGNGVLKNDIEKLCAGSKHRITFRGLVSRQELIDLMLWADVGINPHRSDMHKGGSWPFKVLEYLGTCGTVFCNRTNVLPSSLASRLFLYEGNEIEEIRTAFIGFLSAWPDVSSDLENRRWWALTNYSIEAVSRQLSDFLSHGHDTHDTQISICHKDADEVSRPCTSGQPSAARQERSVA